MGLFTRRSRMLQNDVLDTVIGPSATWRGTLRSDGGVRVEGRFEGCIEVAGNVVVAESGMVDGDIIARDVIIGGIVRGDVEGAGRLEVLSTGQLIGDITVSSFMIDEGGLFEGISRLKGAASARTKALPAPMEAMPELPDVVIAVDGPKRKRNRAQQGKNGAESVAVALDQATEREPAPAGQPALEPSTAAVGVGAGEPAVETAARSERAAAQIIDPEPIAEPVDGGLSSEDMDSFLDGLDLDIEPIIPDASTSNGAARKTATAKGGPSSNGASNDESNGKSSTGTGRRATPARRAARGPSKSAQRRATAKNGTRA